MRDRHPRRFFFEDLLRFLIERGPFTHVGGPFGFFQQIVERFVTPASAVGALGSGTTKQHVHEIVGVAVISGPSQKHGLMLALAGGASDTHPIHT